VVLVEVLNPTQRRNVFEALSEMFADVVQLKTYCVRVVVNAVVPVAVQSCVPPVLLRNSLARGKLETFVEVTFIHTLKVTVEPERMTPVVPGTPDAVGNCLTTNSPGLRFIMSCDESATAAVSGPAVFN